MQKRKINIFVLLTILCLIMVFIGSFLACDQPVQEKKKTKKKNNVPVAVDDTATTSEGTMVSIDVLANDTDADADALSIESTEIGSNGITEISEGKINYTPTKGYIGEDTFTYTVTDGRGGTATGNVSVTVEEVILLPPPENHAPVANDDNEEGYEDTILTIPITRLLENDTDPDGDTLKIEQIKIVNSIGIWGTIEIKGENIIYNPPLNFYSKDNTGYIKCLYSINDGKGGTDTAILSINVKPVNDSPVAEDDTVTVTKVTSFTSIDVLSNDSDVEGNVYALKIVSGPGNGTAYVEGTVIKYKPNDKIVVSDTIVYSITDKDGASDTATLNIIVDAKFYPEANDIDNPGAVWLQEPGQSVLDYELTVADKATFTVEVHLNANDENIIDFAVYGIKFTFDPAVILFGSLIKGPDGIDIAAYNSSVPGELFVSGFDAMGKPVEADMHILTITFTASGIGNTDIVTEIDDDGNGPCIQDSMLDVIGNSIGYAAKVTVE